MEGYSALVSRVLKSNVLVEEAADMTRQESLSGQTPTPLNLISLDWDSMLENDIAFQNCQFRSSYSKPSAVSSNNKYYDFESSINPCFSVTLAGNCRFGKLYEGQTQQSAPVIISNSEPLSKMARAMTNDLGSEIQISDEFKFIFKECSRMSCVECNNSYNFFAKEGYPLQKFHQPCICVTKVFDGKNIVNRFHSQMVDMFPYSFIAIIHLKINARYSYDSNDQKLYRIGGTITNILAMNEAKLDFVKSVNLGDISAYKSEIENVALHDEPECSQNIIPNNNFCKEEKSEPNGNNAQLDIFRCAVDVSKSEVPECSQNIFPNKKFCKELKGNNTQPDIFEIANCVLKNKIPDNSEMDFCDVNRIEKQLEK